LLRAEPVDKHKSNKDFKFETTDDNKGNPNNDEQFFEALGSKQYFCPQGHLLEEQKVAIIGKTSFACEKCKKNIEEDYYYCKTDNEVYHANCADNNASVTSFSALQAKGAEVVDEQQASGTGVVVSPKL
jgi:hypothetical protein